MRNGSPTTSSVAASSSTIPPAWSPRKIVSPRGRQPTEPLFESNGSLRSAISPPVAGSHSRAVWSLPTVTRWRPTGVQSCHAAKGWSLGRSGQSGHSHATHREVVDADLVAVQVAQPGPIRARCNVRLQRVRRPVRRGDLADQAPITREVPGDRRPASSGGIQGAPVRAETDSARGGAMAREDAGPLTRCGVPDLDRGLVGGADERPFVGGEGDGDGSGRFG
jgi:hypothetical protein